MKKFPIGITFVGLLVSQAAAGQSHGKIEAQYSREYNQCMNSGEAAEGVTLGILNCNGTEIDRQDARLNQAYKMVMIRLNAAQKSKLRFLERAWVNRRDARCRHEAAPEEGGTLASIIYSGCILNETIARRQWLEAYKP